MTILPLFKEWGVQSFKIYLHELFMLFEVFLL